MTMKKSLLILTALAVGGAFATDIPWDPETKAHELGADDVITFSSNQTINGDYTFTGTGTIKQTAGELKLSYTPLTAGYPFINFAGRIVIENATLNGDLGLHGEGKGGQANHCIGENSTLVLKNATFNPICRQSANTYLASLVIEPGANGEGSKLVNTVCRSGSGHGAHVTVTGAISGSGDLDFEGASRKFELQGDNSGYSGEMYVHGTRGDGFSFRYAQAGSAAASFVHDRTECVYIYANTNEEIALGAFSNGVHTAAIDIASRGPVVKIGAREGTDSYISVPFITNPVTLKKVGDETTLTLAEGVAFRNDSILDLTENANVLLDPNGLSNVIVRVSGPTTIAFANGVRATVDDEGVVTLSRAEEGDEIATARLGAIERLVDGAYVAPAKIVVPEGVRFTLGRGQTINATIEGAGRFGVSDGQFWGLRNSTMTGFTGILELGPSARVYPTMEGQVFGGGSAAQIVMKGAEISCGDETGAYLDKPYEIMEGTENSIWAKNANMRVGSLTGKGYLTYNTSERRGPQLNGDNREFEGTVRLYSGWRHEAPPTGFYGNHAGSAKAVWLLQDDWNISRDGSLTYTIMNVNVNGDPIQFGAFRQTGPKASIRIGSTAQGQNRDGMKVEVGARGDVDSIINGHFTCSRIAFKKVGAESCLMLGTGFGAEANSTFNFAEGTLGFNLPGADGAMTTLTSYGVTIAEGVKIRVAMTADQFAALDPTVVYEVAKLPSKPTFKPASELFVDGAAAEQPEGASWKLKYWKVRFEERPATETAAAYTATVLRYSPGGVVIIVR